MSLAFGLSGARESDPMLWCDNSRSSESRGGVGVGSGGVGGGGGVPVVYTSRDLQLALLSHCRRSDVLLRGFGQGPTVARKADGAGPSD